MPEDRKIRVTCGEITLQLTLSAKLLAKPFEEAVLRPFLKAYTKKTGEPADVARVARVEIDEEMLGNHQISSSVVLLARETVNAEVFLRPLEVEAAMRANELIADPFAPLPELTPGPMSASAGGRTVHAPAPRDITQDKFDEDNLTPVERLKKERREAREARERLDGAAAANAVLQEVPTSAPSGVGGELGVGVRVRVDGLASAAASHMNGQEGVVVSWRADKERWEVRLDGNEATVNVKPANLVLLVAAAATATATPPPSDGGAAALKHLEETEGRVTLVDSALRELEEGVRDLVAGGSVADADGSFRSAALRMISGHTATLNKLMASLDELSLGEVEDVAACTSARVRKKAVASLIEATLLPKTRALLAQLQPPPAPASSPAPAQAVSGGSIQSAEIDSDED